MLQAPTGLLTALSPPLPSELPWEALRQGPMTLREPQKEDQRPTLTQLLQEEDTHILPTQLKEPRTEELKHMLSQLLQEEDNLT